MACRVKLPLLRHPSDPPLILAVHYPQHLLTLNLLPSSSHPKWISYSSSRRRSVLSVKSQTTAAGMTSISEDRMLVFVPPHPLIKHWVSVLRNEQTPCPIFNPAGSSSSTEDFREVLGLLPEPSFATLEEARDFAVPLLEEFLIFAGATLVPLELLLLVKIARKYPGTFADFKITSGMMKTYVLNALISCVKDFSVHTLSSVESHLPEFRRIVADLEECKVHVPWLIRRLTICTTGFHSTDLYEYLNAEISVRELGKEVAEVEKEEEKIQGEMEVLRAKLEEARLKKTRMVEQMNIVRGKQEKAEQAVHQSLGKDALDFITGSLESAMAELGRLLMYEASRDWLPTITGEIQSPMGVASVEFVDPREPVAIVPILRAGLAIAENASSVLPTTKTYHLGISRDEETLQPHVYLNKLPENFPEGSRVFVVDPMLATGGTIVAALDLIKDRGVDNNQIKVISAVVAPPALQKLSEKFPGLHIYAGIIDPTVNEQGFIIPGLGDAGDRCFGT